ncbi:hypothetical protein Pcinc_018670 [Petrolisthes cinctipes]|uniref:Uncharacterized protein n=1 Tax=Petrolisthes cinctipes TaxID=88211 RepID=A0AAE1FNN3_PETCI|nr:hypothetical protein Pcinc_018670 [Petrolisthes cinctipes]
MQPLPSHFPLSFVYSSSPYHSPNSSTSSSLSFSCISFHFALQAISSLTHIFSLTTPPLLNPFSPLFHPSPSSTPLPPLPPFSPLFHPSPPSPTLLPPLPPFSPSPLPPLPPLSPPTTPALFHPLPPPLSHLTPPPLSLTSHLVSLSFS